MKYLNIKTGLRCCASFILVCSFLWGNHGWSSAALITSTEEDQKILTTTSSGVPQVQYALKGLTFLSLSDLRASSQPSIATAAESLGSEAAKAATVTSSESDVKQLAQKQSTTTNEAALSHLTAFIELHNKAAGDKGIHIDNPKGWLTNQMVRRFDNPHKNPWHAVIATNSTGKPVGVIGLGMFPTTTYADTKPESGHPTIKAFFMKMGLIDGQNKPVDNAGLAHFVMAFDPQASQDERFLCVEAAVVISKSLASKKSPLPRFGHLPKALMVMAERGDKEAAATYGKLGFTLSEDIVWDLIYPGKKRVAFFMTF